ncbi:hypothetical protein ACB092_07G194200 [Castanea dentata]
MLRLGLNNYISLRLYGYSRYARWLNGRKLRIMLLLLYMQKKSSHLIVSVSSRAMSNLISLGRPMIL